MNSLNVYEGEDSVMDFLNPDKGNPVPLVEIPKCLNPFAKDGVQIFAKLMNMTPLGNVKSLPAFNMLQYLKGEEDIHTLVENSSGNTVFSLAVIGKQLGVENTKAFVSHEVSWGKLQLLRLMGTQPLVNEEPICPDPSDTESGIYKAKVKGEQEGWFNPGQYDSKFNPDAHYKWTGPQIWAQTKGQIDLFCSGLGTTGTMFGTGGFLKEKNPDIKNIGVVRSPNNPVPGVRTPNLLRQIAFGWESVVDDVEEVGTVDSFRFSLELCRHGLIVGPSSGFALKGLLQYIKKTNLKNATCVFMCADSPLPYLNEYFEYLDEGDFPKIENEDLLINKPDKNNMTMNINGKDQYEVSVSNCLLNLYGRDEKSLWKDIKLANDITIEDGKVLFDVRTTEEFEHVHAPASKNINHVEALEKIDDLATKYKDMEVYVICRSGGRSEMVTLALREKGVRAYNVTGGMIEWSKMNYPRIRPRVCVINHE